jgi:HEPN domain-containing protein
MDRDDLDIPNIKSYWIKEADEALTVAEHLFEKGHYSYALFFGHLAMEKILKGLYVDLKKEHAPPIHNLARIAGLAGLSLDEEKIDVLILISSFNIEARYPDLKRSFRKRCTKVYTLEQMRIIKETFQWLKEMIT